MNLSTRATITLESLTPDRQPHIITIANDPYQIAKQHKILQNKGHHHIAVINAPNPVY